MSGWFGMAAASALVGVIELDVVQAGQVMLSRPLVLGSLLGIVLNDPRLGFLLGAYVELLSIDDLPMGDRIPLNATVAVSAAFLLAWGPRGLPCEAALPAGLCAGWVHRWIEAALRLRRKDWCAQADAVVRRGGTPSLGRMIVVALVQQAAGTLAVMLVTIFVFGPVLRQAWIHAPAGVVEGIGFAWLLAPWLGLGVLLHTLRVIP